MNKPEIEQSIFQKRTGVVAKMSFWVWFGTIIAFSLSIILGKRIDYSNSLYGALFLGNICLGIVAFLVAVIGHEIAKVRTPEAQKSFYDSLKLLFVIALAFPVIVFGSGLTSKAEKVFGENTSKVPTTMTTIATPQPTPTPKPKVVNTQPKTPQITCTGPDYKTFQTSETECIKFRTAWGLSASATPWPDAIRVQPKQPASNTNTTANTTPINTYKPTVYPVCTVYYPTINFKSTYYYMTAEECAEANKNATANVATPTPAPVDTAALIAQCKANVDAKYYPIFQRCNSYDAATHQLCYETNTNSKNAEYSACNSLGN